MNLLLILFSVLVLTALLRQLHGFRTDSRRYRQRRRQSVTTASEAVSNTRFQPKPDWVCGAVLELHAATRMSHRKLADEFNRLYTAERHISVGRTWVRQLLLRQAYAELQARTECKHRVPAPIACNRIWGFDTTCITTNNRQQNVVFGIIDHGSRLNLCLNPLRRLNAWTLLGHLFLAIGHDGKPAAIRLDNHPIHRAKWVRRILRWVRIRLQFTRPASPSQNGRIERMFGSLKAELREVAIHDPRHLSQVLQAFRFHYNVIRPHQHLDGCTPSDVWLGIDPVRQPPRRLLWFDSGEGRLRGWVLRH